MKNITFEFEGHVYEVGMDAYASNLAIALPDGRTIQVIFWLESCPPEPADFQVVTRPSGRTIQATLRR